MYTAPDENQLLGQVEDLIRTVPDQKTLGHSTPENFQWFGRLMAVMTRWHGLRAVAQLQPAVDSIQSGSESAISVWGGYNKIMSLLHEARFDLMMKTGGPQTIAFDQGAVFHYFDSLRKVIETARSDLLFVDRYMGADFIATYLPHVRSNVAVRLLTRDKITEVKTAADMFAKQYGLSIEIRSSESIHDRYLIVDRSFCHQSGASFKDGAKASPTTLSEVIDAAKPVIAMYENYWSLGKVLRTP